MKNKLTALLSQRGIRFIIIGGIATLIHATVYYYSINLFYYSPQASNVIGFTLSLSISYFGQRLWTFGDIDVKNENMAKLKFIISSFFSYALNTIWVFLNTSILTLNPNYSLIGIVFLTPVTTFIMQKYWVFKKN